MIAIAWSWSLDIHGRYILTVGLYPLLIYIQFMDNLRFLLRIGLYLFPPRVVKVINGDLIVIHLYVCIIPGMKIVQRSENTSCLRFYSAWRIRHLCFYFSVCCIALFFSRLQIKYAAYNACDSWGNSYNCCRLQRYWTFSSAFLFFLHTTSLILYYS